MAFAFSMFNKLSDGSRLGVFFAAALQRKGFPVGNDVLKMLNLKIGILDLFPRKVA